MEYTVIFSCLLASVLYSGSYGYPSFQNQIPNGRAVPHPCIPDTMWLGVGHENPQGAGTRNPFGIDFNANGRVWDATLCNKDSDGDGMSNGEELGDPGCVWTPGATPTRTTDITHPGVCGPIGSSQCSRSNSWVVCTDTGSGGLADNCPVINDRDTIMHEVRFPTTPVPAEETTYMCMTVEFPNDQPYHLVASDPIIDNLEVMHHILVFGCEGADAPPSTPGVAQKCNEMASCREIVALWGAGGSGNCIHDQMGFLIGGDHGLKYAVMEFHWNNPMLVDGYTDSSGYKFYLTPNLRPNNAGVLMIGQSHLAIPPNSMGHVVTGGCEGSCTAQIMTGNINVVSALNHMHLMGRSQFTELRRNGSRVQYLASDEVYDYNAPKETFLDPTVVVGPGDDLTTMCVFQSLGKEVTTNFGEATSDEMCLAFLLYYPKENLKTSMCNAWKSLSHCEAYQSPPGVVRGCDFAEFFDFSNPNTQDMFTSVSSKCTPFVCRKECLDYVRPLKKSACFKGDVGELARLFTFHYGSQATRNESLEWYASLDSCDWELWQEGYSHGGDDMVTGAAHGVWASLSVYAIVSLLAVFRRFV